MRQFFAPIQSDRKAPRKAPGTQKKLMRVVQPNDFQRGASFGKTKTSQEEAKIPEDKNSASRDKRSRTPGCPGLPNEYAEKFYPCQKIMQVLEHSDSHRQTISG
jgi:hypothetical protein